MASGTTSYKGQALVVANVPILAGRAKGAWLTWSFETDEVAMESGVDGEGWFTESGDMKAVITVVLTAASKFNDFFGGLAAANRNAPTGLAFPVGFTELGGTSSYSSSQAKILKVADGTWGDGSQVRTWRIGALHCVGGPGGLTTTPIISAADALALLPDG